MNLGENFETSIVRPLEILFNLVKRKIGQGYSKSEYFWVEPSQLLFFPFYYTGNQKHDQSEDE